MFHKVSLFSFVWEWYVLKRSWYEKFLINFNEIIDTLIEKPAFKNLILILATSDWKYDAIFSILGSSSLIAFHRYDTLRINDLLRFLFHFSLNDLGIQSLLGFYSNIKFTLGW